MRIFAVDPGPRESACVIWDEESQRKNFGILKNGVMLERIQNIEGIDIFIFEKIASYGMAVGEHVFETVFWTGRFCQAIVDAKKKYIRMPRRKVKLAICEDSKASDSNIVTALVDRFDPLREFGKHGKGTKKNPGPFAGFKDDIWQAFALAIAYCDLKEVS